MTVNLMPHQDDAIEKLGNGKVLWGGVGTGKSLTILGYYVKNESPRNIFVITTAKKRDSLDWDKEAAKFGISRHPGCSLHGLLTVDSWNNIGNYVDVEDAFFVFDEQRLVGSGAWVKAFQKIAKKNQWVLLTATPGDTWLDYVPMFIANGLYKNPTEFKREHVVYAPNSRYPRIMRYLDVETLEKYRNMLLVEMPYDKHTTRVIEEIILDYDSEMFKMAVNRRWHPFEDRPIKDVGELFFVMRRIANSDPSRLKKLRELMKKHPRLIVFYTFDYELDILRELYGEVPVGEWNGHRKTDIPDTENWVYLVQYVSGAEGWNCTSTDATVFYSLTYSYKNFEQALGRIDRLDTPFLTLFYYIFLSNSAIDKAVSKSLAGKQLFNERAYAEKEMGLGDLYKGW